MPVIFKTFESKPIFKKAYQILDDDKVVQAQGGDLAKVVTGSGRVQLFRANQEVKIGDFIVDNGPGNISHEPQEHFKTQNNT